MTTRLSNLGSLLLGFLVFMGLGLVLRNNFAFVGYILHPFLLVIAAAVIAVGEMVLGRILSRSVLQEVPS